MDKEKSKQRMQQVTRLAVLTAMSLVVFRVEALFPPLFIPGARIGLSNVFALLTLITSGYPSALILVFVRTLLGSMITGGMSTLIYSMTAGLVSVTVSFLLYKFFSKHITVLAVSVASAAVHNITQNLVFCLVSSTPEMIVYAPYLVIAAIPAGAVVGFIVTLLLNSNAVKSALSCKVFH